MEENKVDSVNETKEEKKKEPMTTKQKVFLGLRIAFNVVFYALIIFLFLFSLMNIRGGNGTESFPNIFGRGFLSVQSDSMQRDEKKTIYPEWNTYEIGGFTTGDLLNVKTFNKSDADKLKVGDVITFKWNINGRPVLNTHRIVEVFKVDGVIDHFVTQGDKMAQTIRYKSDASNAEMTNWENNDIIQIVKPDNIVGVVTSVNAGAGKILDTIQKNWLFIFVIPIIVLLVIEVFLVVRNIMILRGEKNKLELADSKEAMLAEVEAEKEKMRQELLAELRAQGLAPAEDKPASEPTPEPEPQAEPVEEAKEETVVLASAETTEEPVKEKPTTEEVVEEAKEEVQLEEEHQVEETQVEAAETPTEELTEEKNDDKVEEEPQVEAQEEQVEDAPVEVAETSSEEVTDDKVEDVPQEEVTKEDAVQEEAQPEAKEEATDEIRPEIDEDVEEKKEEPKKKAPTKKSTSTTKKASTTKKSTSTSTKKSTSSTKKASTTKKTTTKKSEK